MSSQQWSWAIGFAGLGDPVSGNAIRVAPFRLAAGGVQYEPIGTQELGTLGESVDLFAAKLQQGTISLTFAGLDVASYPDIVRRYFFGTRREADAILAASITAAAGVFEVWVEPGRSVPTVNSTLFLEREAMRVTNVALIGGFRYDVTVTRGVWGTTATAHTAGGLYDDSIYWQNPIVPTREATLYRYDFSAGTVSTRGHFLLERAVSSDYGVTGTATLRGVWGYVAKRKLGKERERIPGKLYAIPDSPGRCYASTTAPHTAERAPLLADGDRMHVHQRGWIVPLQLNAFGTGPDGRPQYIVRPDDSGTGAGYGALLQTGLSGEDLTEQSDESELTEVLLSDASTSYTHFADGLGAASDHPVDIIRCLQVSTGGASWPSGGPRVVGPNGSYDWLPRPWGQGIPDSLIGHGVLDAIKASPLYAEARCSNLVLGVEADGFEAEPELFDVISAICKAFVLFPALDDQGRLALGSLIDPGVGGTAATVTGADLVRPPVRSSLEAVPIRDLVVECARWGLSDKRKEILRTVDLTGRQTNRFPFLAEDETVEAGFVGTAGEGTMASWDRQTLLVLHALRYWLRVEPLPPYELEIRPGYDRIHAGQTITLTADSLINEDGDRGVSAHRCLVLKSTEDTALWTQSLTVLDLYALTRADFVVAPAWRVETVTDSTHFTVAAAEFSADDRALWQNGRRYELFDRTGLRRSTDGYTTGTIAGAGAVTLAAAWTSGAVPVAPVVGDVVRIAGYDDRDAWTIEAYVADANALLGAANDAAHRWGF